MKKSDLFALVAADEMRPALDVTQEIVKLLEKSELQQDVVLLRSQWENLEKEEQMGTISWETLLQNRNRVKRALLNLFDGLPDQFPVTRDASGSARPMTPQSGVKEGSFKLQVFVFMLLAKCWIIYWILLHKSAGGFSSEEAKATILLLLPAFTAYITLMLNDFIKNRNKPTLPAAFAPRVSRTLSMVTWIVFPIYVVVLHCIIGEKAHGALADTSKVNFENMASWLAIAESAFGIYVGQIIHAIFKHSD